MARLCLGHAFMSRLHGEVLKMKLRFQKDHVEKRNENGGRAYAQGLCRGWEDQDTTWTQEEGDEGIF